METEDEQERHTSWRDIQQASAQRVRDPARRRRRLRRLGVLLAGCLVAGLLVVALLWGASWLSRVLGQEVAVAREGPRSVYFSTDGVLDRSWLETWLALDKQESWALRPVADIRQRLLQCGQVRMAEVQRVYPATLRVSVQEHRPYLRVVVANEQGRRHLLLVAADGTVYSGSNYPLPMLRRLPFLAGVALRRNDQGDYEQVEGMAHVAALIDEAEAQAPALLSQWQVVDVSGVQGQDTLVGERIEIRTAQGKRIVFRASGFAESLRRLQRILKQRDEGLLQDFSSLDLTLEEPVLRVTNN